MRAQVEIHGGLDNVEKARVLLRQAQPLAITVDFSLVKKDIDINDMMRHACPEALFGYESECVHASE